MGSSVVVPRSTSAHGGYVHDTRLRAEGLDHADVELKDVQVLVVAFLALAWLSVVAILAVAPDVYARGLGVPPGDTSRPAELLLVAFMAGILRVPPSALELAGSDSRNWTRLVRGLAGL